MPVGRFELASVRPSVRGALAVVALIVAAIVVVSALQGGASPPSSRAADNKPGHGAVLARTHATRKMAKTMPAPESQLFKAVAGVNESMIAKGLLPPSSCRSMSASMVTCTQPHYAVDTVTFRTFPSLSALYAAYVARVQTLAQGAFRANFGNCTETMTNGEVGWNHDFKHPSIYPVSMFTSGRITDDQAAGRLYCTFSGDELHLVWTQDDGRLLAELTGAPHYDAYVWWRNVHHSIVLPGYPGMAGMPAMSSTSK